MRLNQWLCICILAIGMPILGASGAAAFLTNGVQSKLSGLGGLTVAQGVDGLSGNPAGIALGDGVSLAGTAFQYLEMDYGVLGAVWRNGSLGVGVGYISGQVTSMGTAATGFENRLVSNGESVGYMGQGLVLGVGYRITPSLYVGGNIKGIQETGVGYRATGTGADLGVLIAVNSWMQLGLMAKNIVQPSMEWNTPSKTVDTVDQEMMVGTRIELFDWRMAVLGDVGWQGSESIYRLGLEYWVADMMSVWGGMSTRGWSVGTGLRMNGTGVDLTYMQPNVEGMESVYRLGLTVDWK